LGVLSFQRACNPQAARAAGAALAVAAAFAATFSTAVAQTRDLSVVSWGGAYQDGQKEVYFKPFIATGVKLTDEAWDGGLGVLRTKIKGGSNTWDVVQVEADELEVGCDEGLYEKLDAAKIGGAALLEGAGTYFSTVAGPAAAYPGTAKFQADFKAKYGADPKPFAAQGYDSMAISLKAIENAAKTAGKMPTRKQVVDAVRALKDFPGITGKINFNAKGDLTVAKYFVMQVTSADPAKWNDNVVAKTLDIAPPM
jgi:hypothetical protein